MARVPKDSPRYRAALRRAQMAREQRAGMAAADEQLGKENRIRVIVGQPAQAIGPRKRPPFQR